LFFDAKEKLISLLKDYIDVDEKETGVKRKFFQELLHLGLDEIVDNYNYQLNQSNDEFLAFVASHSQMVNLGKKRAWWTFWILSFDVIKAQVVGKEIQKRLEDLIKDGMGGYRGTLMDGVYKIWRIQAETFSKKLRRNFDDIVRDLSVAVHKKSGSEDRISRMVFIRELLLSVQSDTLKLYFILNSNQPKGECKSCEWKEVCRVCDAVRSLNATVKTSTSNSSDSPNPNLHSGYPCDLVMICRHCGRNQSPSNISRDSQQKIEFPENKTIQRVKSVVNPSEFTTLSSNGS